LSLGRPAIVTGRTGDGEEGGLAHSLHITDLVSVGQPRRQAAVRSTAARLAAAPGRRGGWRSCHPNPSDGAALPRRASSSFASMSI
jgi:hypothetical protein